MIASSSLLPTHKRNFTAKPARFSDDIHIATTSPTAASTQLRQCKQEAVRAISRHCQYPRGLGRCRSTGSTWQARDRLAGQWAKPHHTGSPYSRSARREWSERRNELSFQTRRSQPHVFRDHQRTGSIWLHAQRRFCYQADREWRDPIRYPQRRWLTCDGMCDTSGHSVHKFAGGQHPQPTDHLPNVITFTHSSAATQRRTATIGFSGSRKWCQLWQHKW